MGLSPKDPEGRTAWDYAGGMWGELYRIRELLQDRGDKSQLRWLNLVGEPYVMGGGGPVSTGQLLVPPGSRWTALAVSAVMVGSQEVNGWVDLFRNTPTTTGFITRLVTVQNSGRIPMVNLPDNLVLDENTVLIARFEHGGAVDNNLPVLNLATREVVFGPGPEQTREGGEDLMGYNFAPDDPDLEREDQVEYQEAAR